MKKLNNLVVLVKGGGEVASGVAHRLHNSHFKVVLTEIARPLAVSRGTSYCEAVWDGKKTIEDVTAELVPANVEEIRNAWQKGIIPIVVDPGDYVRLAVKPDVIVDATMTKKKNHNSLPDDSLVVGLGPGFHTGENAHIIVETFQNNDLGKVILRGEALPDNGLPVELGGLGKERVIWSPCDGKFVTSKKIGDHVEEGQVIAHIGEQPLVAPLKGWLRGLLRSEVEVKSGTKLIEIDHVNETSIAGNVRNKMRAIAGGVLEAIMIKFNT
jgi:xanthine dehydrogenase accessory factor